MSAPAEVLAAVQRGWSVIPVGSDKRSLIPWKGAQERSATLEEINAQAAALNPPAWAVVTGKLSGVVVLDVDGQDGADSLHDLEAEHGALPTTTSVVTPGGQHYYFTWPGHRVKSTASVIAPDVDIRGDGGIAVIPPSRKYEWDVTVPPAAMPRWLVELTSAERVGGTVATPPEVWTSMLRDGIPDGRRNASLTSLAGHLLRRWVDYDVVLWLMQGVNANYCRPPLPADEVAGIVDSIATSEARRLRGGSL